MKTRWTLLCMLLWLIGCTGTGAPEAAPSADDLAVREQALTTLSVGPLTNTVGLFGSLGSGTTPSYGQVITAPTADIFLERFSLTTWSLPPSVVVRGEIYAWNGSRITGPNLFESGPMASTGANQFEFVFNAPPGGVMLNAGSQYILFATTLRDPGTGSGSFSSRADNQYTGGGYYFSQATSTFGWANANWGTTNANEDLVFSARLMPVGTTATATSLVSSVPNSSAYSQPVTFTATVAGGAGPARGTVVFRDGTTELGRVALNNAAQASLTTSALGTGAHFISAAYLGSSIHAVSTSAPALSQSVTAAGTSVGLTSSSNPASVGDEVRFNASVSVNAPATAKATGTVTFRDGSTVLGSIGLSAAGVALFATSALTPGTHNIVASYDGATGLATSSSATLAQRIDPAATTLTLTTGAGQSSYGGPVTLNAALSAPAASGVPTGSVTFSDGGSVLGSAPVQNGVAQLTTSALRVGARNLSASYGGDARHGSATGASTHTVNRAGSSTQLVSALNPASYAQLVTFTASVTGVAGAGIPTGELIFLDGTDELGRSPLNAAAQASFATQRLRAGAHAITARYMGDANYDASDATSLTQTIQKASTSTSIATSSSPVLLGAPLTFTATVAVPTGAADAATGLVSFHNGATLLGTAPLGAGGTASLSYTQLGVGEHAIRAEYVGDANYAASSSSSVAQLVGQHGTVVALTSSSESSAFGAEVSFTATLSSTGGPLSGSVEFSADDVALGSVALDAGSATFKTATLGVGTHTIKAQYTGDSDHRPASASLTQTVSVAPTQTQVVAQTNPSVFGQSVSFVASVTAATTLAPFRGRVVFSDGTSTLGSSAVDASGVATWSSAGLVVATHAISAQFEGDSNFAPSTALAVSQVVNKASTSTSLAFALNPVRSGTAARVSASVASVAPGAGAPSGAVDFLEGDTLLASATLDATGSASAELSALTTGKHAIRAEYRGDANFEASAASANELSVEQDAVDLTLSADPSPATFGDGVTLTAALSGFEDTASGTVEFRSGESVLGGAALDATGKASLVVTNLSVGTLSLSAGYSGDANHTAASATSTLAVRRAASNTQLSASANPAREGDAITFEASVTSPAGNVSGEVAFFDGPTLIGTVALDQGRASYETDALTPGGHAISARYLGDASFEPSAAEGLSQTIEAAQTETTDPVVPTQPELPMRGGDGCGCHVAAPSQAPSTLWLALATLLCFGVRRRQRARSTDVPPGPFTHTLKPVKRGK